MKVASFCYACFWAEAYYDKMHGSTSKGTVEPDLARAGAAVAFGGVSIKGFPLAIEGKALV